MSCFNIVFKLHIYYTAMTVATVTHRQTRQYNCIYGQVSITRMGGGGEQSLFERVNVFLKLKKNNLYRNKKERTVFVHCYVGWNYNFEGINCQNGSSNFNNIYLLITLDIHI